MGREELIQLIEGIISGELNERERDRAIVEIKRHVAHPWVNNVLRSDDYEDAAAIADELLSWKAQALPPPDSV